MASRFHSRIGVAKFVSVGVAITLVASSVAPLSQTAGAVVPPSASLVSFTADATSNTGAFSVPVSAIPAATFSPVGGSQSTGVQSISLGRISLGRISLGRISLGRISLGRISLGRISLAPNGQLSSVRAALNSIILSDISVTYPHGCADTASTTPCTNWAGILAGTEHCSTLSRRTGSLCSHPRTSASTRAA